ncbi:MAG: hypothetical protein SFY56_05305 [Bacteroidota bacterium]|nr:hypothetical protein [Bacteroidota bacterium]
MYCLSDKQIDFILNDICARGVEMESLQQNLLDHICCIIEQNLEADGDFESFYQKTIQTFYKDALWEIEEETLLLLTFKNYYAMKKTMITGGIFSATTMTIGLILKFLHMPGASLLILLGVVSLGFLFLPLMFILKAKEKQNKKDKLIVGLGTTFGILISFAVLFKIMHWPGANIMGLLSVGIMLLVFTPVYFFTGIRNPDTKVNTIVVTILLIMGCALFLTLVNARPSATIAKSTESLNQHLEDSYRYASQQNEAIFASLTNDSVTNTAQLKELHKKDNELCAKIESLKLNLLELTEGTPLKTINYSNLTAPDNYSIPTHILFNEANANPILLDLKQSLSDFNAYISSTFKKNTAGLINLSNKPSEKSNDIISWEKDNFYFVPLTCILRNLTQLQLELKYIELSCLK